MQIVLCCLLLTEQKQCSLWNACAKDRKLDLPIVWYVKWHTLYESARQKRHEMEYKLFTGIRTQTHVMRKRSDTTAGKFSSSS